MDRETVLGRLRSMVAHDTDPVLDEGDLQSVLDESAVTDLAGNPASNNEDAGEWAASTAVLPGTVIAVDDRYWVCVIGGTTGSTEPSWPSLAGTAVDPQRIVADGGVRWADNGTTWAPSWNLTRAAMLGWERKAAVATSRYDFQTDDQRFSRAQVAASCREQADRYRRRLSATTVTG